MSQAHPLGIHKFFEWLQSRFPVRRRRLDSLPAEDELEDSSLAETDLDAEFRAASASPAVEERSQTARLLVTGILTAGILVIAGGLYFHQQILPGQPHFVAWVIFWSGLAIVGLGLAALNQPKVMDWLEGLSVQLQSGTGLRGRQFVYLGGSLLLAVTATLAAGYEPRMKLPWLAVGAWIAAMILAVLGAWEPLPEIRRINWKRLLILLAFFWIALLIRGINTAEIPHVLSGDEASSGLSAVEFIDGRMNNLFSAGWFSFPSFFFFIQSIPIRLLGQTTPALRLLSAFAGALTVGAIYLTGRAMFGELTGLAAGIFMAAFHFHVNFSRIGLNNIWDGFWFITTLGLFWQAWKTEKRIAFILGGLALGFSQYFYVSARMVPFLLIGWLVCVGLLDRARIKRLWVDFLLAGLIALVIFLPLGVFYATHPEEFTAPMNRVSIFGTWMTATMEFTGKSFGQLVWEQLKAGVQSFTHLPLRFWYEPGTPFLRPVAATAFILGLILLALSPKDDRSILLGLWVFAFVLAVSFSESTPASQRFVGVAPAAALLVASGFTGVTGIFSRLWPRIAKPLAYLCLLLVLLMSLDELRFYFLEYAPVSQFGGDHTLIAQDLADYLQTKDSHWKVLFFGWPHMGYHSIMSLPYLAPHIEGTNIDYPWDPEYPPGLSEGKWVFVFLSSHEADLHAVQSQFPKGHLREVYRRYPGEGVLYWTYDVVIE